MASFIYFYSKFTEEFLLLSAAGVFTLLSVYCYHWVIKKRRLGAARNVVPAGMVKVYLNQLINEAQFVRTQLFGLLGAQGANANPADMAAFLKNNTPSVTPQASPIITSNAGDSAISKDLLERLAALESQLVKKEGMVVNVNIEKTKLLEEIENLKQNQKAISSAGSSGDGELAKKVKLLEERLEEYALFEDDLANLKRLQQENTQLKKRLDDIGNDTGPILKPAEAAPAPQKEKEKEKKPSLSLDQAAIDSLLNGVTPASQSVVEEPSFTAPEVIPNKPTLSVAPAPSDIEKNEAAINALVADVKAPNVAPTVDSFEKLVDSVENSLDQVVAAPAKEELPTVSVDASLASKTDEELLKEFENLLNS